MADISQLEAMKAIVLCKFALCTDGKDHTHHKLQSGEIFSLITESVLHHLWMSLM